METSLCYRLSQSELKSSSTFTWRMSFHQGHRVSKLEKDINLIHFLFYTFCFSISLCGFWFPCVYLCFSVSSYFPQSISLRLSLSLSISVPVSVSLSHTHRMNNSFTCTHPLPSIVTFSMKKKQLKIQETDQTHNFCIHHYPL